MHKEAFAFIACHAADRPEGLVVEIGGRNINGTIREVFREPYLAIDTQSGPGVDVVADGATYTPDEPAACVVCCEVLEHTAAAEAICRHAYRILQAGGVFLATMAGQARRPHSAVDGEGLRDGEFYRNVMRADLAAWLSEFTVVEISDGTGAFHVEHDDLYVRAVK